MSIRNRSFWTLLSFLCSFGIAVAQEAIENWPAPASWSLPERVISKGEVLPSDVEAVEAVPTPPLHFVGITPCRLVDTRGNGFTGQYGPPALTQGVPRNFVLTGRCGISATAQAVSLNVTVTNTQGPGFILIYPQGSAQPTVSTLNYVAGQTVANAAVVPLGTGGAITVIAGVSGTDLILDTNGDYRGGVVTALNGLSGAVTLDSNFLSISTDGQSVFLDSGPGGVLPPGTQGQTLRHNGSSWQASSLLTNDGFDNIGVNSAALLFTPAVRIRANISGSHYSFLNNVGGSNNTFLGQDAGFADCCVQGDNNTGIGGSALNSINVGSSNNTALGFNTMPNLSSGSGNIAIGTNIAPSLTTGSNNLYIGNPGAGNESGQIRIGTNGVHTQGTVIASIYGFGSGSGIPVIVNAGGRMGTTTSSVRYKDGVRDIGADSEGLMNLRPVVFKYKPEFDSSGLRQYGLIAEEVAEIYPELVVYDEQGRPQAIRSQLFDGLFLNEIQKQHRKLETQETTISEQARLIERQQAQLNELRTRLAEIETRIEASSR
jgi:hypothetical protein